MPLVIKSMGSFTRQEDVVVRGEMYGLRFDNVNENDRLAVVKSQNGQKVSILFSLSTDRAGTPILLMDQENSDPEFINGIVTSLKERFELDTVSLRCEIISYNPAESWMILGLPLRLIAEPIGRRVRIDTHHDSSVRLEAITLN